MGLGVSAEVSFTVLDAAKVPPASAPRWAVLGRSNVGKSSLLNALLHPAKFFRTGSKPGVTTGLIGVKVFLSKNKESCLELVDLPGFGYAQHSNVQRSRWEELILRLRELSEERGLQWIWLADPKRKPGPEEFELLEWLAMSPFTFVFTKADQVKRSQRNASLKAWEPIIRHATEGPYWVSAMKGEGFDLLQKSARGFLRNVHEAAADA